MTKAIAVAYGDGIGHEILDAAMLVLREAGAQVDVEVVQICEDCYRLGDFSGFDGRALRTIQRTGVLLKAPTIRPELIEELAGEVLTPASEALYATLELPEQKREWIFADMPEFVAISSIGENTAMFECALEFDAANPHPAGMILASAKMLAHIGQNEAAARIEKALQKTLQQNAAFENLGERVVENL